MVVIVKPVACDVKLSVARAKFGMPLRLSVTRKIIESEKIVPAGPVIAPVLLFKLSDAGKEEGTEVGSTIHVYGGTPPDAARVQLYDPLTMALGRLVVAIIKSVPVLR